MVRVVRTLMSLPTDKAVPEGLETVRLGIPAGALLKMFWSLVPVAESIPVPPLVKLPLLMVISCLVSIVPLLNVIAEPAGPSNTRLPATVKVPLFNK